MKLLGRIVIILLAALAVAGLTYELGQAGTLSAIAGAGHDEGRPADVADAPNQSPDGNVAASGQRHPPGGFPGGERDEGGFSLFGFTEVGKAFLTTAVVVVVAAPIVSLLQRRRRARRKGIAGGGNAPV